MQRLCFALIFTISVLSYPAYGGQETSLSRVGIDERIGHYVPPDLVFTDEEGRKAEIADLLHAPAILSLVYYDCRHICPSLLAGLQESVDSLDLLPGKDFSILTVSFDETDTTALAMEQKKNYVSSPEEHLSRDAWKFLTGDAENIKKLTDAVGFGFKKQGSGFLHPASLVVLSANGKIIRYLYGTTFLPRDLSMAVYEASQGRTGRTVGKVLLYCFSYDPQGKRYVLDLLKVVGSATIVFAVGFVVYLSLSTRAYRKRRIDDAGK